MIVSKSDDKYVHMHGVQATYSLCTECGSAGGNDGYAADGRGPGHGQVSLIVLFLVVLSPLDPCDNPFYSIVQGHGGCAAFRLGLPARSPQRHHALLRRPTQPPRLHHAHHLAPELHHHRRRLHDLKVRKAPTHLEVRLLTSISFHWRRRDGLTLDRFVVEHRDLAEAVEGTRQKLDPNALKKVCST